MPPAGRAGRARQRPPLPHLPHNVGVLAPEVLHQKRREGWRRGAQRGQQRRLERVQPQLRVVQRTLRLAVGGALRRLVAGLVEPGEA